MTWLLRPGVGLARRDADHLQLGIDPPPAAVLPDTRAVRAAARRAGPRQPARPDARRGDRAGARALWSPPGLVVAADDAARTRRRPPRRLPGPRRRARRRPAGAAAAGRRGRAAGSPARPAGAVGARWSGPAGEPPATASTLDAARHARTCVVRGGPAGPGRPLRRPGRHRLPALRRRAPRRARPAARALVVEQLATATRSGRPPDPALRALALAWAVRDLVARREGGVPATWSATVAIGRLPADRHDVPPAPALRLRLGRPRWRVVRADRVTSTRCRACPPSRAGARASSSRSRSWRRPFSTAVLQVRVFASSASCRPQKSQVFMRRTDYARGCRVHEQEPGTTVDGRTRLLCSAPAIRVPRRGR